MSTRCAEARHNGLHLTIGGTDSGAPRCAQEVLGGAQCLACPTTALSGLNPAQLAPLLASSAIYTPDIYGGWCQEL
jgi:hypothetical protein